MINRSTLSAMALAAGIMSSAYAEEMDPQAIFEEAMQLRDSGQIYSSIELFESILNKQPGLHRARLELAIAYHHTRRFEEARAQLTQVLNSPDTPESVKLSITAYLAQLGSDEKVSQQRTSSTLFISTGLFSDSNVNLGPSPETPNVSATETSGTGATVMLSYSHRSRASKPFDISGNAVDMEWQTQATAYSKVHTGEENDYNLHVLSLITGPALIATQHWRASLNIKLEKIHFDDSPYAFNVGLNPSFTLTFDNDMELTLENQTTVREYDQTADEGLDGVAKMYGIGLAKIYKNNMGVEAGMRYHSNGADANYLNANGSEIYLGGHMPAWQNARAYLQISSRDYDYKAIDPGIIGATEARDETEQQAIIGVSHDFRSGSLKSWTANAQLTHTKNNSNASDSTLNIFEYDRNVFEINMRRYF